MKLAGQALTQSSPEWHVPLFKEQNVLYTMSSLCDAPRYITH
jgi:hypothetical protein